MKQRECRKMYLTAKKELAFFCIFVFASIFSPWNIAVVLGAIRKIDWENERRVFRTLT